MGFATLRGSKKVEAEQERVCGWVGVMSGSGESDRDEEPDEDWMVDDGPVAGEESSRASTGDISTAVGAMEGRSSVSRASGLCARHLSPPSELEGSLMNPSSMAKKSSSSPSLVHQSEPMPVPPTSADDSAVNDGDPASVGSERTELSMEVKSALDQGGRMSLTFRFMSASTLELKFALNGVGGVKLNAGISAPGYGRVSDECVTA